MRSGNICSSPELEHCSTRNLSSSPQERIAQLASNIYDLQSEPALHFTQRWTVQDRLTSPHTRSAFSKEGIDGDGSITGQFQKKAPSYAESVVGAVPPRMETLKLGDVETQLGRSPEEDRTKQSALPNDWEQFLNLKTGEVYYMNWSSCKKGRHDPQELYRVADARIRSSFKDLFSTIDLMEKTLSNHLKLLQSSQSSSEEEEDDWISDTDEEPDICDSDGVPGLNAGIISKVQDVDNTLNLVVMGCQSCLIYILCPSGTLECSSCKSALMYVDDAGRQ